MMLHGLRHTVRGIRKQPFFAAVAVGTLGLAIGATTAIFSVVHAVLLAPLAYPAHEPDEVLYLTETHRFGTMSIAYPNFKDWQRMNQSFEVMAGFRDLTLNLTGLEEPLRVEVSQVSKSYFDVLGVTPILGRLFSEEEDVAGAARVLVLNYRFWRNRMGGSTEAIGKVLRLDEAPYTIIGVLPEDYDSFPEERVFEALEPWAVWELARDRGNHHGIYALGRLKGGVSLEEAATEMENIARQLEAEYPATNSGTGVALKRLSDRSVEDYRRTLWTLLGAVSLVLLIACANVANLLLARAVSRKRVTAIQAALGASRMRLVRQGLTEGLVLAVLGGALGVVIAYWSLHLLAGVLPSDVPRIDRIGLEVPVLVFSLGISLLTGILFGSVPALFLSRAKPADPLREGGRDTGGGSAAGRGLLVSEVALATILLIGACLLIRTVYELSQVDPGFRTDHLLTMKVGIPYTHYDIETRQTLLRTLHERLDSLPGVESATLGLVLPMKGSNWSSVFIVGDRPWPPRPELPASIFTPVEPSYFETLSIPLVRGRLFEPTDTADSPRVVVVNETLARRFWPGGNAIGQRLKQGWPEDEGEMSPWREIVGVVGDVNQLGLGEETRMQTYIPLAQNSLWDVQLALRTETEPLTLVEPAKQAVRAVDPSFPLYEIDTMEGLMRRSIAPRRFAMLLLGIFAALALVLAAVGLYGVIAYSVARRTREIGLRMSVGAARSDIFRLVVRQGMGWAFLGAAIGLMGAGAASRLLASFLYGVTEWDPLTFSAVPLILLAVAFAASSAPAHVASRIDPIRALRYD